MKLLKLGFGLIGIFIYSHGLADNVATVNGVGIPKSDLDLVMAEVHMKGTMPLDKEEAINTLIRNEVVYQKGKELKIEERPEVKRQIALFSKQLVINGMLEHLAVKIEITDEEYKQAYEEAKKGFPDKEFHARHILLKDKKTAEDIIKKLDEGGDFATLAKENSIGPSANAGGDLGWFNPNLMDPDFIQGLKKLKKGGYSKTPVKTQFGYHVIMSVNEKDFVPPVLEMMKQQLKNVMLPPKLIDEVDKMVSKAKVVRN